MTEQKRTSRRLQHAARERIKATGEKYTTALQAVIDARPSPSAALPSDPSEKLTPPAHAEHGPDDAAPGTELGGGTFGMTAERSCVVVRSRASG